MSKFKVGDKVVGNMSASKRYTITKEGYAGTVTGVFSSGSIMLNNSYLVNEQCFDLASPANHSIHITCTDGKTTHAVKKIDGKIVARAKAECCPTDEFNFNVGAQLAFNRLVYGTDYHPAEVAITTEQPKQEPVKLYCVEADEGYLTKGKIYDLDADGKLVYDRCETSKRYKTVDAFFRDYSNWKACLVPLVSRPAKVGEWVYVTHTDYSNDLKVGDIAKVKRVNTVESVFISKPDGYHPNGLNFGRHEYLVLDGYTPEPEPAQPEPEYLNMKVICVAANTSMWFTTGKVYEVRNGVLNDNGGKFDYNPHSPARTLEQLNVEQIPEFVEFKGE